MLKGQAAGARWNRTGSAANYLCLPDRPRWKNYVPGWRIDNYAGSLGGVEYQFYDETSAHYNSPFERVNSGPPGAILNRPAPCAVCYIEKSTTLMIPADTQCPMYWRSEYAGYLVSESREHFRSQYLCWDEAPEYLPGFENSNDALVYPVETFCGTLPCSKYPTGRELACIVCSK